MLTSDIFEHIRRQGKQWGVGPSPFSIEGQLAESWKKKKTGPDISPATLMGRVGGLGNGGGKMLTAAQQGRGPTRIL